jgi:hypothetical protein
MKKKHSSQPAEATAEATAEAAATAAAASPLTTLLYIMGSSKSGKVT